MKSPKIPSPAFRKTTAFRGGSYSLLMSCLVLAILILFNILMGILPATATKFDISSSQLYSVTSNTKTVLNHLEQDVTIYWVVQAGKEDEILSNLLQKYESLSEHITVVRKNPDVYPAFLQQYTEEPVQNNCLVVECGTRSRYIGYDDIYLQKTDLSARAVDASFDGEGAITSAIDYVVSEEQPKLYALEGHGESELPETFREQITKANMELESCSLLNSDGVPEDADGILIHAPSTDLSAEEAELLRAYVRKGGKLLVLAGPSKDSDLQNLYSILADYGVEPVDGVVVEADRSHYAFRLPYVLMPETKTHRITQPLVDENYFPIVPLAGGLQITEAPGDAVVTQLLTTSDTSFSKAAGLELDTYEKEEGDPDGPFALGVAVEVGAEGEIIWFSSSLLLDELYNAYSSGANVDLAMNALADLVGESEAMSIRTKSLNYNYLTINESTASILKVLMIGVLPLAYLGTGILVVWKRRERYHETV